MPAASVEMGKETVRGFKQLGILSVQGFGQDADLAKSFQRGGVRSDVETVLGGQEHGPGGEHDGWVIENPIVIESDEVVDRLRHERMPFLREHEVIGNTNRYRFREDNWEDEEWVEGAKTANVQVDIHPSIVVKNEISNGVGPLNRVCVGIESVQEPGIVLSDEFSRTRVRPEHIFAETDTFQHQAEQIEKKNSLVGHHFPAAIRNTLPPHREGVCFPRLVQNAWNAFLFPVLGGVPSRVVIWGIKLLLGQISSVVDCEIIREGGENDDCTE